VGRIQNSKFKIQNLIRDEHLGYYGRNFLEPCYSWFLACCQFSDDCRVDSG